MSSETWFASDHHFGHKNIFIYEAVARPFATVEEMNEALIERWNSVVRPQDKVYHLGDFAFGRKNVHIACRLNGLKRLIMGNHDIYGAHEYLMAGFRSIHGAMYWDKCLLTHVPVHPNCLGERAALNLHGHLHSKRVMEVCDPIVDQHDPRYYNVGVEQNNLHPVNADIIRDLIKRFEYGGLK